MAGEFLVKVNMYFSHCFSGKDKFCSVSYRKAWFQKGDICAFPLCA
jgi:hypothetical protein